MTATACPPHPTGRVPYSAPQHGIVTAEKKHGFGASKTVCYDIKLTNPPGSAKDLPEPTQMLLNVPPHAIERQSMQTDTEQVGDPAALRSLVLAA